MPLWSLQLCRSRRATKATLVKMKIIFSQVLFLCCRNNFIFFKQFCTIYAYFWGRNNFHAWIQLRLWEGVGANATARKPSGVWYLVRGCYHEIWHNSSARIYDQLFSTPKYRRDHKNGHAILVRYRVDPFLTLQWTIFNMFEGVGYELIEPHMKMETQI